MLYNILSYISANYGDSYAMGFIVLVTTTIILFAIIGVYCLFQLTKWKIKQECETSFELLNHFVTITNAYNGSRFNVTVKKGYVYIQLLTLEISIA